MREKKGCIANDIDDTALCSFMLLADYFSTAITAS